MRQSKVSRLRRSQHRLDGFGACTPSVLPLRSASSNGDAHAK
ncbi:hypothetical protein [Leptolyngbya sp. ST-U4]